MHVHFQHQFSVTVPYYVRVAKPQQLSCLAVTGSHCEVKAEKKQDRDREPKEIGRAYDSSAWGHGGSGTRKKRVCFPDFFDAILMDSVTLAPAAPAAPNSADAKTEKDINQTCHTCRRGL